PERRQPPAHRAIEHSITDANDHAAEDRCVDVEMRHDVFAKRAFELRYHDVAVVVVRLARHRDRRVHSALDPVDEIIVLARYERNEHLPAMADERLKETHEI